MAKAAVQENRNRDKRQASVFRHEKIRHGKFGDVEFLISNHAPMADVRAHIREHRKLNTVGLDRTFFEGANAFIIARRQGEMNFLAHGAYLARLLGFANARDILNNTWVENV